MEQYLESDMTCEAKDFLESKIILINVVLFIFN